MSSPHLTEGKQSRQSENSVHFFRQRVDFIDQSGERERERELKMEDGFQEIVRFEGDNVTVTFAYISVRDPAKKKKK